MKGLAIEEFRWPQTHTRTHTTPRPDLLSTAEYVILGERNVSTFGKGRCGQHNLKQ